VGQEGLDVNSAALTTRFNLLGRQGRVPVLYEGVLPDMFKAGADVVAEGRRDEAGVFRATSILTKCASKYNLADYADGRAAPERSP
jgi:cytochrome c-type biogenesis protein CcmE